MNVFGEQPKFRTAAKNESWPIKLAMKYGAKTEKQANLIVIVISIILLIATVIIYKNTFFPAPDDDLNLINVPPPPEVEVGS